MPEWLSAVVPIEPTFVAGPLITNKFFRSVGSLGLSAYSGEFWGGLILVVKDFSMSSDFSKGGRGFLATIEKGIWVLGRDCVSFREEC